MTPEQRADLRKRAAPNKSRLPVMMPPEDVIDLLDALDAAEARAERAEADADRLRKFADHSPWGCSILRPPLGTNGECDCGLAEALAAHDEAVKQRPLAADPKTALSTVQEMPDPYKEAAHRQAVDEKQRP